MKIYFNTISCDDRGGNLCKNTLKRNVNFKSSELYVPASEPFLAQPFYRATTEPLRGMCYGNYEFDWFWWRDILQKYFGDSDLTLYNMACSDGSEAYSHAIAWLEGIKNNRLQKGELKIIASDINKTMIYVNKEHKINFISDDIRRISNYVSIGHPSSESKYFIQISDNPVLFPELITNSQEYSKWYKSAKTYMPVQKLQDMVSFKNMDMLTHLQQITDEGNSVISCSNVFPYLTYDYVEQFITLLLETLKENSIFKISAWDRDYPKSPLYRRGDLYKLLRHNMKKLNNSGTVFQMK